MGTRRVRAMACGIELVAVSRQAETGRQALERGVAVVHQAERRWSRFLPSSELSELNRRARSQVSPETTALLARAVEAWRRTSGRFDPTVLDALEAAGYDRSFDELERAGLAPGPGRPGLVPRVRPVDAPPRHVPGLTGVSVAADGTVVLPDDVRLDLGGIAKGWTADLAVAAMLDAGAIGACANLGGDVRVAGEGPDGLGWVVGVEDPGRPDQLLGSVAVVDGAVATSSSRGRAWWHGPTPAHHLIDPATGRPAATDLDAAVVIAGDAAWAEVLAKSAILAGAHDGARLLAEVGVAGLLIGPALGVRTVGEPGWFPAVRNDGPMAGAGTAAGGRT